MLTQGAELSGGRSDEEKRCVSGSDYTHLADVDDVR
jgi:hypothetical protein